MSEPQNERGRPPAKRAAPPAEAEQSSDLSDLAAEIDRQVGDTVPGRVKKELVNRLVAVMVSERFSGPIAHPRHLREYEEILPGSADRIIGMAERQLGHHIAMEANALAAETSDRRLGMLFGATLFFSLIAAAFVTAILETSPIVPGLFLTAAAIGGVSLFVKGRNGGK